MLGLSLQLQLCLNNFDKYQNNNAYQISSNKPPGMKFSEGKRLLKTPENTTQDPLKNTPKDILLRGFHGFKGVGLLFKFCYQYVRRGVQGRGVYLTKCIKLI